MLTDLLEMVWRNPMNPDRPFLQVHGCCVYKLTTRNPATGEVTIMDDVEQVRKLVYSMQRKIYAAENIYAHRWEEGDLVIFHNRGVMHSITGQLAKYKEEEDKRNVVAVHNDEYECSEAVPDIRWG